ncbi:MAG: DUF92 domain-containing protein [Thermoplasmata archaeon]|nr:DUF92 domain-containing protein [Thermoplasmata archaeon]
MALPIPDTVTLVGVTCFCLVMAGISYYKRVFDLSGSLSAFIVGMVIGICGNVLWLLLLLVFLLSSFGATRYRLEWKRAKGFQEGRKGERNWRNIAANGAIPTLIAFASFVSEAVANGNPAANVFPKDVASFMFVTAVAVAAADTAASEIGIVDPRVYLITTFRRIKRGTDGGVSLTGQLVAFVAAAYTSAIAYVLFAALDTDLLAGPRTLLIPMLSGFLGCQIDSVIGATWERSGKVGKLGNNFISIAFGTLLALLFALGSL